MKCIQFISIVAFTCLSLQAQHGFGARSAGQVAARIDNGFAFDLRKLDSRHLVVGSLKVVIENTGYDSADPKAHEFTHFSFRSFTAMERWLKNHTRKDGTPFRSTGRYVGCKNGQCTYSYDGGIDHNHLYLQKIFYGFKNRRLYIKSLYLLAG